MISGHHFDAHIFLLHGVATHKKIRISSRLMHPEVLHDLRNPLRKLVTTPSLIAYSRHRCLLISTTWSTSKNDFWTPRLVLIHSEFVHPWDEVFRQSLVIPDYKYKPHIVLFLRCFQDLSSECIDAYMNAIETRQMSGNLDLEQLLIIMYITGWDQHVFISLGMLKRFMPAHGNSGPRNAPKTVDVEWCWKPGFLFTTTATSSCTGIGLLVRTGRVVIGLPVFLSLRCMFSNVSCQGSSKSCR